MKTDSREWIVPEDYLKDVSFLYEGILDLRAAQARLDKFAAFGMAEGSEVQDVINAEKRLADILAQFQLPFNAARPFSRSLDTDGIGPDA